MGQAFSQVQRVAKEGWPRGRAGATLFPPEERRVRARNVRARCPQRRPGPASIGRYRLPAPRSIRCPLGLEAWAVRKRSPVIGLARGPCAYPAASQDGVPASPCVFANRERGATPAVPHSAERMGTGRRSRSGAPVGHGPACNSVSVPGRAGHNVRDGEETGSARPACKGIHRLRRRSAGRGDLHLSSTLGLRLEARDGDARGR